MSQLIFNSNLCTGCRACELACSFVSEGVCGPSQSRVRVVKIDEEGIDVPVGCTHCEDAPCITICPVKAINRHNETEAVLIDHDVCIGCKECLTACPFGAIQYDEIKKIVYKCDLCGGDPECVKWCYTGAIQFPDKISRMVQKKQRQTAIKIAKTGQSSRKLIHR